MNLNQIKAVTEFKANQQAAQKSNHPSQNSNSLIQSRGQTDKYGQDYSSELASMNAQVSPMKDNMEFSKNNDVDDSKNQDSQSINSANKSSLFNSGSVFQGYTFQKNPENEHFKTRRGQNLPEVDVVDPPSPTDYQKHRKHSEPSRRSNLLAPDKLNEVGSPSSSLLKLNLRKKSSRGSSKDDRQIIHQDLNNRRSSVVDKSRLQGLFQEVGTPNPPILRQSTFAFANKMQFSYKNKAPLKRDFIKKSQRKKSIANFSKAARNMMKDLDMFQNAFEEPKTPKARNKQGKSVRSFQSKTQDEIISDSHMSSNIGRKSRKKQKIKEENKRPFSKTSNENKYTDNESMSQRSKLFSMQMKNKGMQINLSKMQNFMKKSPVPENIDGYEVYSTDQLRNASSDQQNPLKSMSTSKEVPEALMLGEKKRSSQGEELEKQILFEKQDSKNMRRSSTLGAQTIQNMSRLNFQRSQSFKHQYQQADQQSTQQKTTNKIGGFFSRGLSFKSQPTQIERLSKKITTNIQRRKSITEAQQLTIYDQKQIEESARGLIRISNDYSEKLPVGSFNQQKSEESFQYALEGSSNISNEERKSYKQSNLYTSNKERHQGRDQRDFDPIQSVEENKSDQSYTQEKTQAQNETLTHDILTRSMLNRRRVYRALLCYPEDNLKLAWDIFTSIVLVLACFMTPFSLAFERLDSDTGHIFVFESTWTTIESIIDIVFLIEIVVCFNTSYYEQQTNSYVSDRLKIFNNYTRSGWFLIDCMAVLPRFLRPLESEDAGEFTKVLSFLKIGRIGRLFKLFRLLKLSKTLQQKDKLQRHLKNKMRLSVAKERLIIFSIFSILFVHTISCLWIFLGAYNIDSLTMNNWITAFAFNYDDMDQMYIIGIYWTITTITTVGYGDIYATNTPERIVATIIMIIGVIAFSFSTGSLSSIIQNIDSRQATYRRKLEVLKELRVNYGLDDDLYMELNAFINFQSSQHHFERDKFIDELPDRLKFCVSECLYAEYSKKINFFKNVQDNQNFIAWICPNLKPLEVIQDSIIQREQEKLTCISFIKQGEAVYVVPRFNNRPYLKCSEGDHFGVMDIVFRLQEYKKIKLEKKQERHDRKLKRRNEDQESNKSRSESASSEEESSSTSSENEEFGVISQRIKCKFTIKAYKKCYLLQLPKQAIEKMKIEFPEVLTGLLTDELEKCYLTLQLKAKIFEEESLNTENRSEDDESSEEASESEMIGDESSMGLSSQHVDRKSNVPVDISNIDRLSDNINRSYDREQVPEVRRQSMKPPSTNTDDLLRNFQQQNKSMRSIDSSKSNKTKAPEVQNVPQITQLRDLKDIKEEESQEESMLSSSSSSSSLASSRSEIEQWKSETKSVIFERNKRKSPEKTLADIKVEAMSSSQGISPQLPQLWNTQIDSTISPIKINAEHQDQQSDHSLQMKKRNTTMANTNLFPEAQNKTLLNLLNINNQIDAEESNRSSSRSNMRRSGTQLNKSQSKRNIEKLDGNLSNHSGSKKEYQQYRRSSTSKSNKKKKLSETNSDVPASALNRKQTESSNNRRISFIRGQRRSTTSNFKIEQALDRYELMFMEDIKEDMKDPLTLAKKAKDLTRTNKKDKEFRKESMSKRHSVLITKAQSTTSDKLNALMLIPKVNSSPNTEIKQKNILLKGLSSSEMDYPEQQSPEINSILGKDKRFNADLAQQKAELFNQQSSKTIQTQLKVFKESSAKDSSLKSLMERAQKTQEMILQKINVMSNDMSNVKQDQERLLKKSNKIRSGHKKLMKMSNSEASIRYSQTLQRQTQNEFMKHSQASLRSDQPRSGGQEAMGEHLVNQAREEQKVSIEENKEEAHGMVDMLSQAENDKFFISEKGSIEGGTENNTAQYS